MLKHPFEQREKRLKIYQVDAFSDRLFAGNPAAVCILDQWIPEKLMQQIAAENNLSETAFCVRKGYLYELRWFTPTVEVDLCGHATLATAHVLFAHEGVMEDQIIFSTASGELRVKRMDNNHYQLDFPEDLPQLLDQVPEVLEKGLGAISAKAYYKARNTYMIELQSEEELRQLQPDLQLWSTLEEVIGVLVTAKGELCDFVSRSFFPQAGVDEDPVTGSAHTVLTPFWTKELNKKELYAQQISARKGQLKCLWENKRVYISGQAKTYLIGELLLP
jgi:PhzF family phenazine biosynthesis protein